MDTDRFKQLVARLETESAAAPGAYRAKVAGLTLLGFGILALLLGAVGFGLLALVGVAVWLAFSGMTALVLLLKFGKVLVLLAIPLWFLAKSAVQALFIRLPAPQGREVGRDEAPALFEALDRLRAQMKGPRFHQVLIVDGVNAAVVQRPAFGLVGWPRNHLLLGLPLLESLPPAEALAVVAHEYGHLAGSHGHFSAFVYRLRHTWGTVQAYTDHIRGWLGRLVAPLVGWYAPYFNAYTFVLARADEYQADAASAELVGAENAAHALKRVNLVGPQHQRFMQQTLARVTHDAAPPADLMQRWAVQAGVAPSAAEARRWLADALDREGDVTDSHPTLRARLSALAPTGEALQDPPPPVQGDTAAVAWLGPRVERLRADIQALWAAQVAQPWAEQHADAQRRRLRLDELRRLASRDTDQQIEMLKIGLHLEPELDQRAALAAFNAEHADHALGLFLEGSARLDHGDRDGLALLDRAMQLDPEATQAACEQAHRVLVEQQDQAAAQVYAERWRARNALEALRTEQLETADAKDTLQPHGLDAATVASLQARLADAKVQHVAEMYLARRVIPADPGVVQHVLGVKLNWWGRRYGRQPAVVERLLALELLAPLMVVTLDGELTPLKAKFQALPGARLV